MLIAILFVQIRLLKSAIYHNWICWASLPLSFTLSLSLHLSSLSLSLSLSHLPLRSSTLLFLLSLSLLSLSLSQIRMTTSWMCSSYFMNLYLQKFEICPKWNKKSWARKPEDGRAAARVENSHVQGEGRKRVSFCHIKHVTFYVLREGSVFKAHSPI